MTETTQVLYGPKILLEGPAGTGKTYAIGKLVDWAAANDMRVFTLFTENGLETLLGYWADSGKSIPECLHYHSTLTKPISLTSLMDSVEKVGKFSYELVTKMVDNTREKNNAFHKILGSLSNFKDDRTGELFGPADAFTAKDILVIDSLSELANAAFKTVIGNKPTASQPDYGVAQNMLINFLRLCTQGMPCTFVLTAHVERQTDEITGGVKLMTKAIGKALANDIPQLFSDVIYTVREGDAFYWDTAASNVDLKSRNLPIRSKQAPDFGVIMDKWKKRSQA